MTVIHIVMFKFRADASPDTVGKAVDDMLALKESCLHSETNKPYIKSLTGGKDNSPEGLQNEMQYAFVVEFESIADRDFYVSEDKAHDAFKASAKSVIEKVIVVDYTVPDQSK